MKVSFKNKLIILFSFIIVGIVVASIATYRNNKAEKDTYYSAQRSREVLYESEQILSATQDIVLSTRGFVITGDPSFLGPFEINSALIYQHYNNLAKLVEGNASQQARLESLKAMLDERINFSTLTVSLRKEKGFEGALKLIAMGRGTYFMNAIKNTIKIIQEEENKLHQKHKQATLNSSAAFSRSFYILMGIMVLLLLFVLYIIRHNLKLREKSAEALAASEEKLKNLINISPVGISLSTVEGKILESNQAIIDMFGMDSREDFMNNNAADYYVNKNDRARMLEQFKEDGFVKIYEVELKRKNGEHFWASNSIAPFALRNDETALLFATLDITQIKNTEKELKAVNKELEAFSYSISHDLRAPLRGIGGHAKILLEDYPEKFDEAGVSSLNAIMNNSKKMGVLIDDLLSFSRLGRKEVNTSRIDMTELVNSVKDEVMMEDKNGTAFNIHALLPAYGDQGLIKQVWINLISNAVKYSRNKPQAFIEIGSYTEDNEVVYYVRDNGAGFDMRYYQKLFGVFQRLHSDRQFEGTGIGLAIVQKIILRHQGSVWAESTIDEGSCFYFSLPIINS